MVERWHDSFSDPVENRARFCCLAGGAVNRHGLFERGDGGGAVALLVLRAAKPDVMIMHPGPMNRGVEIAQDVAEDPRNVILDQVTNGVAVRMAVLYLLNGNEPASREAAMDMVEA